MTEGPAVLSIGEVAKASGLTPRTLRYYEERGLVPEPERTDGGHRVYTDDHVARIYQVQMLRGLGLSLDETSAAIANPTADLHATIASHLRELDAQIEARNRLRTRLLRLANTSTADQAIRTEDLLNVMEEMTDMQPTINKRISILIYADIAAAFDWLSDTFGLGPGEITRGPDGVAHLAELEAGDGVLWLHPESDDFKLVSPATAGQGTAMMAVMVDDVDAHHAYVVERGATIVYEPVDQPYGYREYSAQDCEGHLWSFMKPLS